MIDLHCHILPNLDDGPKDLLESMELVKRALENGITAIVATPHHKNGRYHNEKNRIEAAVKELNANIQKAGINMIICSGQEIRIYGELLDDYKKNKLLTINGSSYMLVELPSNGIPAFTEQILFDLQLNGITPIIVHPERNAAIMENPDMLYKLIKNGALSQITAASIDGKFGKKIKNLSIQLIEANLTHFIASDAHNLSTREIGLVKAYGSIDSGYADYFRQNAKTVLTGGCISKEPPYLISRKKKFFGLI
ncbi:tyrosine-protein phosphatase [Domibacillus epiphyticus]|uniref:Tyrosine-protein phosphatase n=1 Tax=Domibacillus epiphyticus TaxID=1714355 RepID=A0A1V2A5N1_9BACI|nr:CpsB/CapC family capsule biosynthesis tyrosine phosphatase [Domibacillus epiphyticus]OMP66124.1 tyrosine protein phosphatase [Domibacillus epiphyticus]